MPRYPSSREDRARRLAVGLVAALIATVANAEMPAGLSAVDWADLRGRVEAARYAPTVDPAGGFRAFNAAHAVAIEYGRDGATRLASATGDEAGWSGTLRLTGYGYRALSAVSEPRDVTAAGGTLTYTWDDTLAEWWQSSAAGLEQGFTLARPPAGADGASPLRLELAWSGTLEPRARHDGADFTDAGGRTAFTYAGLRSWDARGRALPTRLSVDGSRLALLVEDRDAVYPVTVDPWVQVAYLKASNTDAGDDFGYSVAISGDTAVVGANGEGSNAKGVDGNQASNSASGAGAAYVFVRSGATWIQQAYLKASNTGSTDHFGCSVAISGDTVVVGAYGESSNATGVDGNQTDNSAILAGAAYVFLRSGTTWAQQAYLKASNTGAGDYFGLRVAISGDTVVVGASQEDSSAAGINGDQSDDSASGAGAAYVFARSGTTWSQQAYLKASNSAAGGGFGNGVAISGATIVVGAPWAESSGTAYVFVRTGTTWSQQTDLKASNSGANDGFGPVAISGDTVVVGAPFEDSNAIGIDGNQGNNSAVDAGAAYVFVRSGTTWAQQAYLKASNTGAGDTFGLSVAISGDTVVVGAPFEDSGAGGDQSNNSAPDAGAAYVFMRGGTVWSQQAYLKAWNTDVTDRFGWSVAVAGNSGIVGAWQEDSLATGVDGDQADNSAGDAGAAYLFVVTAAVADLAVAGTDGVTTATPGGSVTYTITASNPAPSAATAAAVADRFPASLTCTWTCVGAGGGTCNAAGSGNLYDSVNLPAGGSVAYTASCGVATSATGVLTNLATVTPTGGVGDPTPANNSASDTDTLIPQADLGITITDNVTTALQGGSVTYTVNASNSGPSNAPGATVADTFPPSLTCTWTCIGAGGSTCASAGSGSLDDRADLPSGGSVTYTASCSVAASASGTLSNTATVSAPGGVTDPSAANNSATDTDTVGPQADLAITKTDGVSTATPGDAVTYAITASNAGPSNAPSATVADTFPASLTCTWTCVGASGGTCTAAGSGNLDDTVDLPVGGSVTYTASCSVSPSATIAVVNTATVAPGSGITDPVPANDSATDVDAIGDALFTDGFATGDTSQWSGQLPSPLVALAPVRVETANEVRFAYDLAQFGELSRFAPAALAVVRDDRGVAIYSVEVRRRAVGAPLELRLVSAADATRRASAWQIVPERRLQLRTQWRRNATADDCGTLTLYLDGGPALWIDDVTRGGAGDRMLQLSLPAPLLPRHIEPGQRP